MAIQTNKTLAIGSNVMSPVGGITSSFDYSTSERAIGTWIDGSILYQKVITGLSIGATSKSWTNTQSSGTLGISIDILVSAIVLRSSDKAVCKFMNIRYDTSSQRLQYYVSENFPNCDTIIIQYTKTQS